MTKIDPIKHKQEIRYYNALKKEMENIKYKQNEQRRLEIIKELDEIERIWNDKAVEL